MKISPLASNEPVALDAALRWRDDVLAVRHLADRGVITAGEGPNALGPIPGAGFAFARLDGGVATISIPPETIATLRRADASAGVEIIHGPAATRLRRGDTIELPIGALTLSAAAVAPISLALDAPRGPRARGALFHVGLAAAAHLAVLGLSLQAALASVPEDAELAQTATARDLLISAEQADRARDPLTEMSGNGETLGSATPRAGDGRAGGGQKAAGVEGKMGDRDVTSAKRGHYAVPERIKNDLSPSLAREEALSDAAKFGMIGLLGQGPASPTAAWSADFEAHGRDSLAARGNLWGDDIASSQGIYGLGLTGIGEGGGGRGEGIGLGKIGTFGHTDGPPGGGTGGDGARFGGRGGSWGDRSGDVGIGIGTGRLGGSHRTRPPVVRCGWYSDVSGRLPPEAVQRVVRQSFGRFRACYQNALDHNPTLSGRVSTRFVIGRDGAVSSVENGGSDLPDPGVVQCVVRAFYGLSFPQPEGGVVFVTYPIVFSPMP
ncbi:MAG: AgmX/PglI C-terminal domain-containing protein [Byssovorax sp.]